MCYVLAWDSDKNVGVGTATTVVRMRKLRLGEAGSLCSPYAASKWQSQDAHPPWPETWAIHFLLHPRLPPRLHHQSPWVMTVISSWLFGWHHWPFLTFLSKQLSFLFLYVLNFSVLVYKLRDGKYRVWIASTIGLFHFWLWKTRWILSPWDHIQRIQGWDGARVLSGAAGFGLHQGSKHARSCRVLQRSKWKGYRQTPSLPKSDRRDLLRLLGCLQHWGLLLGKVE